MTKKERLQKRKEKTAMLKAINDGVKSGKVVILYHKCEITNIHYRQEELEESEVWLSNMVIKPRRTAVHLKLIPTCQAT